MKLTRITILAASTVALSAWAFHSGGVAECEGCHTMHNSFENKAMEVSPGVNIGVGIGLQQFQAGPYLLKGSDQSSACLNCHNAKDTAPTSYHISTDQSMLAAGVAPVEKTPGGDFAWLKKTYTVRIRGNDVTVKGERHGHNIVAADYNYQPDVAQTASPGGTYPAANLACSSCHDPHGKYRRDVNGVISTTGLPIFNSGSYATSNNPQAGISSVGVYRILGGAGYLPKSMVGLASAFVNGPPAAVSPSTYNRAEAKGTQTNVIYGSGMSEWCANCHASMHQTAQYVSGTAKTVHPAGNNQKLTAAIVANYNTYVSSGIMTNTNMNTAYSTLAPFETGGDYTNISSWKANATNADTIDRSASTNANVMCLSCHRAHASGFESMTRYALANEFMTIADSATTTTAAQYADFTGGTSGNAINDAVSGGMTPAEQQAAYYGRPASEFGPYARNYCNKCHAKD